MDQPNVLAVMLTRDRPELARRAIECFKAQTYPYKRLVVLDTGSDPLDLDMDPCRGSEVFHSWMPCQGWSIGELRNEAIGFWQGSRADIIAHWDDDDWSDQNRLAEQVGLLWGTRETSLPELKFDVVGYNEMLFERNGEAWLFTSKRRDYALGTSLCYWRTAWERKPFPDLPKPGEMKGEDTRWLDGQAVYARSSILSEPRMIARIHGGNTMPYDIEQQIERGATEWRRVPEWDERVNQILEGK